MDRSGRRCLFSVILLVSSVFAQATDVKTESYPRSSEVYAGAWFNVQPVRLYSPPRVVLLEFWSVGSEESRALVEPLNALQGTCAERGLLIVALTEDDPKYIMA